MMRFILLLAMIASCGAERVTKEITPLQPDTKKTREECSWESRCVDVRIKSKSKSKWGKSRVRTEKFCEWIWVCETEEVPVGI